MLYNYSEDPLGGMKCEPCKCSGGQGDKKRVLPFSQAPSYLKFNPYITNGYRSSLGVKECLQSAFELNNETLNIWTHLVGFLYFAWLLLNSSTKATSDPFLDLLDTLVLFCFMGCLLLSSLYHTFCCHSDKSYQRWLTLDLFGVSLALVAIYISGIYFAFACTPFWLPFYLTSVTLIFALTIGLQIIPPLVHCSSQAYSESSELFKWRMLLFTGWACYGVVPCVHFLYLNGSGDEYSRFLLWGVAGMYALSALAFLFYVTRFPERAFAGRINYFGTSHQIWHTLVFAALVYWVVVVCGGVRARGGPCLYSH